MAHITQKFSQKQKYNSSAATNAHSSESIVKFVIAELDCIDVASVTVHYHSSPPGQWSEWSRRKNCITVPNFAPIGQIAAEIRQFFDFSRWRPPPSWIFKIWKL